MQNPRDSSIFKHSGTENWEVTKEYRIRKDLIIGALLISSPWLTGGLELLENRYKSDESSDNN